MKLVRSDGRTLEVRECGPVVYEMSVREGSKYPLPCMDEMMSDEDARDVLKNILRSGMYDTKRMER